MKMKSLHCVVWLLAIFAIDAHASEKPVKLEPVHVSEAPFGSLGISAVGRSTFWSIINKDAKLKSMMITEVAAGSIADEKGLKAKDEVVKIDGTSIKELSVREVTQIWYEREKGDIVRFEVIRGEAKEPKVFDIPVEKKSAKKKKPNQPDTSNAGSRPFSVVSPASASPSLLGPRG